jgi:hypothetical protein
MKRVIPIIFALMLAGCSTIKGYIPSFWDDNQSAKIIDVKMAIIALDCDQPHLAQVVPIRNNILWFEYYSTAKGWRQNDVLRLIKPLQESVEDFYKRSSEKQGSSSYCKIKQKIMVEQVNRASQAILGRF